MLINEKSSFCNIAYNMVQMLDFLYLERISAIGRLFPVVGKRQAAGAFYNSYML